MLIARICEWRKQAHACWPVSSAPVIKYAMFPQEAVQALRLLALRRGKRAVSLSSPEPECCGLLLLYQCLYHHKYVPQKERDTQMYRYANQDCIYIVEYLVTYLMQTLIQNSREQLLYASSISGTWYWFDAAWWTDWLTDQDLKNSYLCCTTECRIAT